MKRMFVECPDVETNFMAAILFDPPLRKAHQRRSDALATHRCCHRHLADAAELQRLGEGVRLGRHVHRGEANHVAAFFSDECLRTLCVNE
jgi:hypothetical protein